MLLPHHSRRPLTEAVSSCHELGSEWELSARGRDLHMHGLGIRKATLFADLEKFSEGTETSSNFVKIT